MIRRVGVWAMAVAAALALIIAVAVAGAVTVAGSDRADQRQKGGDSMPDNVATLEQPSDSPSGDHRLRMVRLDGDEDHQVTFVIEDVAGQVLHREPESFDFRHRTLVLWDDAEDRVWVYSGDVGAFFWEENPDGQGWTKYRWADQPLPPPGFLVEANPGRYDQ